MHLNSLTPQRQLQVQRVIPFDTVRHSGEQPQT